MELLAGDLYGPVNLDDKGENTVAKCMLSIFNLCICFDVTLMANLYDTDTNDILYNL